MNHPLVRHVNDEHDVFIGRGGKWGNPFIIGIHGTRKEVIQKHKDWIKTQPELLSQLHELRGKRLGCFCAPDPCHGDTLAELANVNTDFLELFN